MFMLQLSLTLAGGQFAWWCCATPALFRDPPPPSISPSMILGLSRTPISSPRWRRDQEETFALPVGLSADSSHQSLPLALRDDKLEWRADPSRLGFKEAPTPLIGSYLLHQEFWQGSNSHSPGTNLESNLRSFFEVELKIASHLFFN